MHHVAVVAARPPSRRATREERHGHQLLVWGRGGGGQLGLETPRDSSIPQVWGGVLLLVWMVWMVWVGRGECLRWHSLERWG